MPFDHIQFLKQFGHPDVASAQRLYGLPETGEADAMTLRVFANTPRCGLSDNAMKHVIGINHWGITHFKWWVESFPTGLGVTAGAFDFAVAEAMASWAEHVPLTFERTNDRYQANIVFKTGKGPPLFDGRGNVIARAEMPHTNHFVNQLSVILDNDEPWTTGIAVNGQPLAGPLAHELGHTLGLSHSDIYGQLMHPVMVARVNRPMSEDVQRMQQLYGAKPAPGPGPIEPPFVRVTQGSRIYEGALRAIN